MTSMVFPSTVKRVDTQPINQGNQGVRPNSRPNQGPNQGSIFNRPSFPSNVQNLMGNLINQWGNGRGQSAKQPAPINIESLQNPSRPSVSQPVRPMPPMVVPNEDPFQKPPGQNQPTVQGQNPYCPVGEPGWNRPMQPVPPFVAPNEDPFQKPPGQTVGNTGPYSPAPGQPGFRDLY